MTFKYVEKDTIIHKLHPMTKALLLLAALMLALIFTYDYSVVPLLIVLAFELIIWRIAGIEFWRVAIVIKVLLGIFLFFIIVQGFLYRGGVTPLFAIGHFKLWEKDIGEFTLEGLLYGLFISAKILVVVIAAIIFVMTTSITKMSALAHSLRLPYSFSFTLLAGLRFAPLIFKSFSDIIFDPASIEGSERPGGDATDVSWFSLEEASAKEDVTRTTRKLANLLKNEIKYLPVNYIL